jgi:hypothetical protein
MTHDGFCRLCGKNAMLIKAHILPKGFYAPIWDYGESGVPKGERVPVIVSLGETGRKPVQTQSGIWDRHILCAACDGNILGPLDKYATHLLIDTPSWMLHAQDEHGEPMLQIIESYDYQRLKLFYMSLLWRSEVTSHSFFKEVKLGPWEPRLREALLAGEPGSQEFFSVAPFCYTGDFGKIMQNPIRQRIGGVNYVRFRYPGGGFVIKVDQRPGAQELTCVALDPGRELRVITKAFTDTQEHRNVLRQLTSE